MRERFSIDEQRLERIAILEIKNKRLEELLDNSESNLRSVFDRVKNGEDVYLCYPDGSTIRIAARHEEDAP
jgi:hypothetical protein